MHPSSRLASVALGRARGAPVLQRSGARVRVLLGDREGGGRNPHPRRPGPGADPGSARRARPRPRNTPAPATVASGRSPSPRGGNWGGKWEKSFGQYAVESIDGESHAVQERDASGSVWYEHRYASVGLCKLVPESGSEILHLPVPGIRRMQPARDLGSRRGERRRSGHRARDLLRRLGRELPGLRRHRHRWHGARHDRLPGQRRGRVRDRWHGHAPRERADAVRDEVLGVRAPRRRRHLRYDSVRAPGGSPATGTGGGSSKGGSGSSPGTQVLSSGPAAIVAKLAASATAPPTPAVAPPAARREDRGPHRRHLRVAAAAPQLQGPLLLLRRRAGALRRARAAAAVARSRSRQRRPSPTCCPSAWARAATCSTSRRSTRPVGAPRPVPAARGWSSMSDSAASRGRRAGPLPLMALLRCCSRRRSPVAGSAPAPPPAAWPSPSPPNSASASCRRRRR